jgi:uncharacterized LabA/DUF88 family protein
VKDSRQRHLKWLDLRRLGRLICARHGTISVKVCFFTAVPDEPEDVKSRHRTFNTALRAVGVDIVEGHHVIDPDSGKRQEKQTDINLALHLIRDAHDNVYDCAYILSSDSDQAATAKMLKSWFPNKYLVGVAPPSNKVPEKLITYADTHFELTMADLERCVFDDPLIGRSGKPIPRPDAYRPPAGWIRPI